MDIWIYIQISKKYPDIWIWNGYISKKYPDIFWIFGYKRPEFISKKYPDIFWIYIRYISKYPKNISKYPWIFWRISISIVYPRKYIQHVNIQISKKYPDIFWIYYGYISMDISRVLLTLGGVCNGFPPFWHIFYYIRLFRAPRRFLGAIKIATESWECILSDSKVWSMGIDLLGNISAPFTNVKL